MISTEDEWCCCLLLCSRLPLPKVPGVRSSTGPPVGHTLEPVLSLCMVNVKVENVGVLHTLWWPRATRHTGGFSTKALSHAGTTCSEYYRTFCGYCSTITGTHTSRTHSHEYSMLALDLGPSDTTKLA